MATYVNNLRLKEIATGAESGTWGTSTNTNLELIADALGSGTEAITTNADTHTTTIADGAADEGRALFLKYTGTLDSACTITLAPNTVNKVWFIENATSGSQNIIISQGSGANITIAAGKIAIVYTDGAGSGAAVLDALADLELSSTLSVAGATTLTGVTTHGGNVVSDTDSTDDLGTTGVRWGNLWVDNITMGGTLAGAVATFSSTVGITGVTTHGGNVVSDADSTDDLGTTGVRWANLYVDAITMGGDIASAGKFVTSDNGALAAVAVSLGGEAGTGLWQDGAGILAFAANGVASFKINSSGGLVGYGGNRDISGWRDVYASDAARLDRVIAAGSAGSTFGGTVAVTGTLTTASDVIIGTNPAAAGDIRLNKNFIIGTRNNANDANKLLFSENVMTGNDTFDIGDNTKWTAIRFHVSVANVMELTQTAINLNKAVTASSTLAVTGATALGAQATLTPTDAAAFTGYGINYGGGLVAGVDIKPNTGEVRMGGFSTSDYYPVIYSDGVVALSFGLGGAPTATFAGAVSKASGSFKIDHPLPAKKDTHHLVHSFVEGPRADLIYRGVAALSGGSATVDLDAAADMSAGTWELLCRDPQCWIQNDSGWAQVRGSVAGSTLTIACEDAASTDSVSWMVVAERCDPHIMETDWTDENGRVIVEPEQDIAADRIIE